MRNLKHRSKAQLGQIVKVLKGRDAGMYCVVTNLIDDRYVLVADGQRHKFDAPKRKNIQHLEFIPFISNEVVHSLQDIGRVTNAKLRYAVEAYVKSININAEEKGDCISG